MESAKLGMFSQIPVKLMRSSVDSQKIEKLLTNISALALSTLGLLMTSLPSSAAIPLFNATCPGKIEVHADQGGPIYINGKEAKLTVKKSKYYEAKLAKGANSDIVISDLVGCVPRTFYLFKYKPV